ncbi:hypothetical protein [Pseudomonas sp. VD9]|uniref:hypothetical protein n=1 Tax=Pseudomonas sp. VD9 TaxID=3342076 RepID=UPI003C6C6576
MKCKLLYCTVLLSLLTNFATGAPSPLRNGGGEDIILQGFHWNSSRNTPEKWYQVLARMGYRPGRFHQDLVTARVGG